MPAGPVGEYFAWSARLAFRCGRPMNPSLLPSQHQAHPMPRPVSLGWHPCC